MASGLAKDETLRSVLPKLMKPEDHVRVVLGNMAPCRKKHGNAHVRIGVTGKGKVPYHRVFFFDDDGQEVLYQCFDGINPFVASANGTGWSDASMSMDEVMKLLGEIRAR